MMPREKSQQYFATANAATDILTAALWEACCQRNIAEKALNAEAAMMRAEFEKRGETYSPSTAEHTQVMLTEVQQPIEDALRVLIGDEAFEREA